MIGGFPSQRAGHVENPLCYDAIIEGRCEMVSDMVFWLQTHGVKVLGVSLIWYDTDKNKNDE